MAAPCTIGATAAVGVPVGRPLANGDKAPRLDGTVSARKTDREVVKAESAARRFAERWETPYPKAVTWPAQRSRRTAHLLPLQHP